MDTERVFSKVGQDTVIISKEVFYTFDYAPSNYAKELVEVLGPRLAKLLKYSLEDELTRKENEP